MDQGLLTSLVTGGLQAWTLPLAYLAFAQYALLEAGRSPWMWPVRPPADRGAWIWASLVFAAGPLAFTVRGARTRLADTGQDCAGLCGPAGNRQYSDAVSAGPAERGCEMGMAAPMAAGYGYSAAGGERGKMRAADADRDGVARILSTAYSEGRLSKDEYDARLESALSARTYADLDQVVTDLPAAQAAALSPAAGTAVVTPVAKTNGLAMASLACGVAQFAVGPLATIAAIVLGYMARGQIKRTGEQGAGLALAGLILGWAAVILGIALIAVMLTISSRSASAGFGGLGPAAPG